MDLVRNDKWLGAENMINRQKPEGPNLQISVLHRGIRAGLDGLQGREVKSPSLAYVKELDLSQLVHRQMERERDVFVRRHCFRTRSFT